MKLPHVAVIGAGVIGVLSAYSLRQKGFRVSLFDPAAPGNTRASSFGNGGWLSPSLVLPGAMPGLWKQVPRFLLDPKGPLTIDIRRLPKLAPWLLRFVWNGATEDRVRPTCNALSSLVRSCPNVHAEIARSIGAGHLVERSGLLFLYRDRDTYAREVLPWAFRREMGATWTELGEQELRLTEPHAPQAYKFGVLVDGGHALDPGLFVKEVADFLFRNGVAYHQSTAFGFVFESDRLLAVKTDKELVGCNKAVISAGAWSSGLAALVGDKLPLEAERGHHIIISGEGPDLRHPVLLTDRKITVRRVASGTKITGQVDFSGLEAPANPVRFEVLRELVTDAFPILRTGPEREISKWMGRRPSLPDGKPAIGRSRRSADVIHAFGHGHIGFASAPETARLVAQMVCGEGCHELDAFSPARFT